MAALIAVRIATIFSGKRARRRSPENVLEEMKTLYYKYGIREIAIADDIFNVDAKRAEKYATSSLKMG